MIDLAFKKNQDEAREYRTTITYFILPKSINPELDMIRKLNYDPLLKLQEIKLSFLVILRNRNHVKYELYGRLSKDFFSSQILFWAYSLARRTMCFRIKHLPHL